MSEAADHMHKLTCTRDQCPVQTGGLCLEGFDDPVTDCTFARASEDGTANGSAETTRERDVPKRVREDVGLYHGEALTIDEAGALAGWQPMRVIALVGEPDCGKTTLLAALYDCFQTGGFAGYQFAGTFTPRGFERRCHASRVSSGSSEPATERTPVGQGVCFLHLSLRRSEGQGSIDYLFADRSGEHLAALASGATRAEGFRDLLRADVMMLLVNGLRLADPRARGGERHKVMLNARALFEGGSVRPGVRVLVVLTKLDVVRAAGQEGLVASDVFSSLVDQLRRLLTAKWPVSSCQVAARSTNGTTRLGLGLDSLLVALDLRSGQAGIGSRNARELDNPLTPYDRFSWSLGRE